MIILDESESLLSHFDEQTMSGKEIGIWNFFDELLKHSNKMLLMDGDISDRSLSFASAYGELTYINNKNTGAPRTINLMLGEGAVAGEARRRPRKILRTRTPASGSAS